MSKTALELSREDLRTYRPGGRVVSRQLTERWRRAREAAGRAAALLRTDFGASRVVAFGSIAREEWFTPWSDIDLAAWGIPVEDFYRAVASVNEVSEEFLVDLVDGAACPPKLRVAIDREQAPL
jgi:predicted nucleotidyltransferase